MRAKAVGGGSAATCCVLLGAAFNGFGFASAAITCNYTGLLMTVPHLAPFSDVNKGESFTPRCEKGYYPQQPTKPAFCDEDARWQTQGLKCIPDDRCPNPFNSSNARTLPKKDFFDSNQSVVVICHKGDITKRVKCLGGSLWDQELPACEPVICPKLVLEQGDFRQLTLSSWEAYCFPGYRLEGSITVHCLLNETWGTLKSTLFPTCIKEEPVVKTPRYNYWSLQWIGVAVGVVFIAVTLVVCLVCHLRKDSPKRNRLMHNTSHVDELLHLRRTKPIVIPEPVTHTQVHYTHDRKPIPVTSL